MSITAYVGLPGHGKSYGVVQYVILPALKSGRQVVTNIPLNIDLIKQNFPDTPLPIHFVVDKDKQDEAEWVAFPKGAIYVIDEIWRLFPAGVKVDKIPEYQKSFLAEHRHMVDDQGRSTDIIFVTQDLSQINSFSRNLIENTYKAVKLTKVGSRNSFRVDVYEGAPTGQNIPDKLLIRSTGITKYKKEVYQYYKSHTMSDTDGNVTEVQVDNRSSIFGSVWFKYGIPMALFAIFYGLYSSYNSINELANVNVRKENNRKIPVVESSSVSSNNRVFVNSSLQHKNIKANHNPDVVDYSYKYRIKGFLNEYVYFTNGTTLFRSNECRITGSLIDLVCKFNGETVTVFTGQDSTLNASVNQTFQ